MEPISATVTVVGTIYSLIKFASKVWSELDDIRSADSNIQDHRTEISLLSTEFTAIYSLLRTATRANNFNDFPRSVSHDVETGLTRFQDALRRADGMVTNVSSSQGRFGRIRRAGNLLFIEKEF